MFHCGWRQEPQSFSRSKGDELCGGLTLARPKVLLYHSSPKLDMGREYIRKGSCFEIRAEGDHEPITVTGKTYLTWKNLFNLLLKSQ